MQLKQGEAAAQISQFSSRDAGHSGIDGSRRGFPVNFDYEDVQIIGLPGSLEALSGEGRYYRIRISCFLCPIG
jgi:hypothetical protein